MAKRELSSTLRNLKFMQRAALKEEAVIKEEKEVTQADGQFPSVSGPRKCIVIMEGDPHPGATGGRISFLSFNPSVDKLDGEASNSHQQDASDMKNETVIDRANGSLLDEDETSELENSSSNEGLKRKQVEDDSKVVHHPDKSLKKFQDSSPQNNRGSQKQKKKEKLDWNVLRPSKCQNKKK